MADPPRTRGRGRMRNDQSSGMETIQQQLGIILTRLNALEGNVSSAASPGGASPAQATAPVRSGTGAADGAIVAARECTPSESRGSIGYTSTETTAGLDATDRIIGALSALTKVRSNRYYISNFDPCVNDIDAWCEEVDRARELNCWDDNECLARIANCLKGDAKSWLNDWVSNDRSWTNFKLDFKPLCSRRIDIANILFEVMCTSSNDYTTYAEYARRSLLRLQIVKGLSEELTVAIIIRGITDPQIRAATTNAKLMPKDLVEFLSIYVKSKNRASNDSVRSSRNRYDNHDGNRKRARTFKGEIKCFSCDSVGHVQRLCPKRLKSVENNVSAPEPCSFCKKLGHVVAECFAKQRSEARNKKSVNFCHKLQGTTTHSDVTTAVIQGVPTDVLIDSGSHVSLISEAVLRHFNCNRVPTCHILKGIGSQNIESTSYVTLVVEFPDISLEIDLLVVPVNCMSVPIIVGTDVLNREGVAYVRVNNQQRLMHIDRECSFKGVNHISSVMHISSSEQLTISTPLEGADREKLLSIIDEFKHHLVNGTALSTVNTGSMHIELTNSVPVHYRPYKLALNEKIKVREIVRDLLDKGVIRESESPYASPIILVKKKDGSDRMCVDYRALNAITVKDRFPLPLIDDHIDRLGKSNYFSCLDMATGFHQIKLDEDSVSKTAFVTPEGHFEYLKMPYGLANAPVVYQRIISKTLRPLIDAGKVLCYVDDVIILASSIDEAFNNLRETMEVLTAAGFSINKKKSVFVANEVEYLGRRISQGQVRPSPRKIQALIGSPIPSNVKQVRQLLGLAGYFRRYIPNYATETACVARLTKVGVPFIWGNDQERARKYVIRCLTNEPVLAIFDPELPTELHTDASSIGYGAVLIQEHEGKKRRVVAYFSKSTQGAEKRYHSYELETLAIVKALQHFRQYLLGISFKIITDCNALKLTERKRDLLPRIARWWIYMQDFNFSIEYRKGSMMSHADYLSRNPVEIHHITRPQTWAQIAQSADEETRILIDRLNNNELDSSRYVVRNDLLYYKYTPIGDEPRSLCFIPKGHRLSLLRIFHDQHEHIGIDKTIDLILRHFWFPGLRAFVKKYIGHCLICLSSKRVPRAPHQPITSWTKPDVPFSTIHMDVLGPLPESNGFKFVLIIVDAFSKYCLLNAIKKQNSNELKQVVSNAISLFGTPKLIVCDRARMFESADFQKWVSDLGCQIHFITPDMHNENGQVERYCRTVLNMLRVESDISAIGWSRNLWKIQLVLNSTKHKTTQSTPLQLLVGIEGATPALRSLVRDVALDNTSANREALRELRRQRASELMDKNRKRQDKRVNQARKITRAFKLNDMVFVSKSTQTTGKLDSGMRGPYRVTNVLPHGRYELRLMGGSYGKKSQAAAEHMVAWRGEWTPDTCSTFFDSKYN